MNKTVKALILVAAGLVVSILFWRQTFLLFSPQTTNFLNCLIGFGVLFIIFLAVQGLIMVIVRNRLFVYLEFLLSGASVILFFHFSLIYICALVIFFVCFVLGYELVNLEAKKYVKVFFNRIMKRGMLFMILALSLSLSFVFYLNDPLMSSQQDQKIVIPDNFIKIVPPSLLGGIFGKMVPLYQPGMTVDEFISASLLQQGLSSTGKNQINSQAVPPEILNQIKKITGNDNLDINILLKNEQVKKLLEGELSKQLQGPASAMLTEQKKALSKQFGFEINGQDKIENVLSKFAAAKLNAILSPLLGTHQKELSILLAVIFFLVVFSIFATIAFLGIWVAKILFSFLRLISFVKIEKAQKEVEELSL